MTATLERERSAPVQARNTRRDALSLAGANGIDRLLQFASPFLLTRLLSVEAFGHYRIFWLITLTVSGLAPFGMPRSLLYFLPRSDPATAEKFVRNTVLFLAAVGLIATAIVIPWVGLSGHELASVNAARYVIPAFVFFWIVSGLLDTLPNADQRIRWQSGLVLGLAVVRFAGLMLAASTGSVTVVLETLLAFILFKTLLLCWYLRRFHGRELSRPDWPTLSEQVKYAAPFGLDAALYSLRANAEHWIVVLVFRSAQYAVFSVTAYLLPLVDIVRGSISNVLLPKMSQVMATGDFRGMLRLSREGSLAASAIVVPGLAFLMANTEDILRLMLPGAYAGAAPVMRVYAIGLLRLVLETTGILMVLKQGRFIAGLSACLVGLVVIASYTGAKLFGLPGAVAGGVIAYYVEAFFSFRKISRLTGVPVHQLQDWRGLAIIALSAASGAIASHWTVTIATAQVPQLLSLVLGGLVMLGTYLAALQVMGYGWMAPSLLGMTSWRPRAR